MSSEARFQSFLGPEIEGFLAHKRSLRRRYDVEEKTLALLDAYLLEKKIGSLVEATPGAHERTQPGRFSLALSIFVTEVDSG